MGLISPMFYEQLLLAKMPKVKKALMTVFFALWGSAHIKAARKMYVELTPWSLMF